MISMSPTIAKVIAGALGGAAFFLLLFLWLGFLASDRCLDHGGALSGSWFACADASGTQLPWVALLSPVMILVSSGVIGVAVLLLVRYLFRKISGPDHV